MECKQIQKHFIKNKIKTSVLKDLNFSIIKNEILVITGKSGEGKSVLLWLLGLLDSPSSGEIYFQNQCVTELSQKKQRILRRDELSIIFQDFNLIPSWTVLENVMAALQKCKISNREKKDKAIQILNQIGLENKIDHFPIELSIGQKQRAAIARSLIMSPKLLLADEPTGGLDPISAQEITSLLITITKKNNITLVITTHGLFPLDIADRVMSLENGKLLLKHK